MIYFKKKSLIKKAINKIKEKTENFKFPIFSFSKGFFLFFAFLLVGIYSSYLFLLPKYLTSEIVENAINNHILKYHKYSLDVSKFIIKPDYKFNVNLKADSVKILYPNNMTFIGVDKVDIDLNLFSLLFGNIDLNKIKTNKVEINTNFRKDKSYECFRYIVLNPINQKTKFRLRNINLVADLFKFNLYDENVAKNYYIKTDKIKITTSDYKKPVTIKTKGVISSSDHKISDFELNLLIKLDENSVGKFKQKFINLNYNPFAEADKYKFFAKSKIDLKINPTDKKNNIFGSVALSNYTFEINKLKLPQNSLTLNFKNNKITTNCDFKFLKEQYVKIKSTIVLGKNNFIEATLNSNELNLADLRDVFEIAGKIFNFKYNLNNVSVFGIAKIDAYLKSDFKTLNSNGKLLVKNARIVDKKTGLILKDINSDINFADNHIDILNTSAYVNNAKFNLIGKIDSKTNLNLKINSDELNIAQVLNLIKELPFTSAFAPKLKDYVFKSGLLKINSTVGGNFKKPILNSNSILTNFKVYLKKYNCEILIPKFEARFLQEDIVIPSTKVIYENIPVYVDGKVKNYKTDYAETILNIKSVLPKENKIIKIKNSNPSLNCAANIKQNKILISLCNFSDLISINGEILNIDKQPNLNLKTTFLQNTEFILPSFEDFSFTARGNIYINGNIEKPNVVGSLIFGNIQLEDIGLKIDDLVLNIQNSAFRLNVSNGKIFDIVFDLASDARIQKDKLIVDSADISSDYINLENFEKYLKSSKTIDKFNYEINNLKANILTVESSDVLLNSVSFEGNIKDDILNISNFSADTLNGKISGNGKIDLLRQKTQVELKTTELNIRQLSSKLKELSIAVSGKLTALISAQFVGFSLDSILNTFNGDIKFNIENGELAQFAKLERFLQAGNILSQSIFKSNFSALTKQSTGDFKTIDGKVKIKNSIANIEYVNSQGSNMSLNIEGDFNLLNQNMDAKILGRIPNSSVNFLENFDKKDSMTAIEKRLSVNVSADEINKIPQLAYQIGETQTREFVVLIDGIVKNINSIKEFKWIIK